MVWACIEKSKYICGQESDGDGDAGKKGEEYRNGGGWITSGTTCQSERELSGVEAQERVKWRRIIRSIVLKVENDAGEEEEECNHYAL